MAETFGNRALQRRMSPAVAPTRPSDAVQMFCGCQGECHCAERARSLPWTRGEAPETGQPSGVNLQRLEATSGSPASDAASGQASRSAHGIAERGLRGASGALPHLDRIQRSFGRHDLSDVQTSVGGEARAANERLGSLAYARGRQIAFKQSPDLRLAAHEAAHVVQQARGVHLKDGIGRPGDRYEQHADRVADQVVAGRSAEGLLDDGAPSSHAGRMSRAGVVGSVQAQADDEPARPDPRAPVPEVDPGVRPGVEQMEFRGVTLYFDGPKTRYVIRQMVLRSGMSATVAFVNDLEWQTQRQQAPSSGGLFGIPRPRSPLDESKLMRMDHPSVHARFAIHELLIYQSKFRDAAEETLNVMLDDSRQKLRGEAVRYGLDPDNLQAGWAAAGAGGPQGKANIDTTTAAAARDMVTKLNALGAIEIKRHSYVKEGQAPDFRPVITDQQAYDKLTAQAETARVELATLFAAVAQRHPVIAAVVHSEGDNRHTVTAEDFENLQTIVRGGAPQQALIASLISERLDNIQKLRDRRTEVHPLELDTVVEMAKIRLHTPKDSPEERAVLDMLAAEQMDKTLLGIAKAVVIVALSLIAAIPSGGSSLIAAGAFLAGAGAAALSVASAMESIREYQLRKAEAGTALDRADALSREEPTLLWVALDVVGAVFDVGAAAKGGAGMLKAAGIFRRVSSLAKEAQAVEAGSEAAVKLDELRRVGNAEKPGLGDRLAASLQRLRSEGKGVRRLGVAGVEEGRSAEIAVREAEEAGRSAGVAADYGGKVTVTRRGQIWTCASPCVLLRQRYLPQLAADRKAVEELTALEARAAAAGGNATELRAIEEAAAKLEKRLRLSPADGWSSPMAGTAEHAKMLERRGSAAFRLDRKPTNWTGAEEALFRYGREATAEKGYRWVLDGEGRLRYERMNADLPPREFDELTGARRAAVARPAAVALESPEELERLAQAGAQATNRADWLSSLRRVPGLEDVPAASLERVLAKAPNLDHIRGELLEALSGGPLSRRAKALGRGAEFVPGHRITDAAGRQLSDGLFIRRTGKKTAEVLVIGESKAGEGAAKGLVESYTSIKNMTEGDRAVLEGEAIEELRRAHPELRGDALRAEALRKQFPEEIEARMHDINTRDIGQVERDFERLMPGYGQRGTVIKIDGEEITVTVSRGRTSVAATAPTDVSVQQAVDTAGEMGIRVDRVDVGVDSAKLEGLARQLRAEQLRNGSRLPN